MDVFLEALWAAWSQLGDLPKIGIFAQGCTWGLLAAALGRPSRTMVVLALLASTLGFFAFSLLSIGEAEYATCSSLDRPQWCDGPIVN